MNAFSFITYAEQSQNFLDHLKSTSIKNLPCPAQFTLESRYRSAEMGKDFLDLSFCVSGKNGVEAFVLAHKIKNALGFNACGIEILENHYDKKRAKAILDFLHRRAKETKANLIKINDPDMRPTLSDWGQEIFNSKGSPDIKLRAAQDLNQPEEALFLQIRNSYRSLINKSKSDLHFTYVTSETSDKTLFDDFRAFHKETAGRQTRPTESWDVQFEMIKSAQAELIMGYMKPYGLVSSALFTDYADTTSYAVAVYDRSLFDKPLAHASVYEGMLRAKNRGQTCFNLGIIPPYNPDHEKEYNIGKFKKGFCRSLSPLMEWSIKV